MYSNTEVDANANASTDTQDDHDDSRSKASSKTLAKEASHQDQSGPAVVEKETAKCKSSIEKSQAKEMARSKERVVRPFMLLMDGGE